MENQEKPRFFSIARIKNSLTLKIIVLGVVWLMLLIPLAMTGSLRRGRSDRAAEAEREVSAKWGAPQRIVAPVMRIGLVRIEKKKDGTVREVPASDLFLLPDKLTVTGSIRPERRYRGIYPVLLYRAKLGFDGEFTVALPRLSDNLQVAKSDFFSLQFGISDIKGITAFKLDFGGRSFKPVPGAQLGRGIHCELPPEWLTATRGKPIKFHAELELNGCRELLFQPIGSEFTLKLDSLWPHPSFVGGFLPIERKIGAEGFSAAWKISELNRSYPQSFIDDKDRFDRENELGVALVQLAGPYQQVARVNDYASLVIAIVLFAFLIGERAAKTWIHPLQYLFAGLSLVLFYTLLLALGEHLSFALSYAASAALIVVLTTGYAFAIFGGRRIPALLLGLTVALAYALVYALVRMEDYALLVGSGILFVMLALLMKFTGHINRE